MDQEQALQVTELGKREVTGQDRLHPLLAADTNPDVSSCNKKVIDHVITVRVFITPFCKSPLHWDTVLIPSKPS